MLASVELSSESISPVFRANAMARNDFPQTEYEARRRRLFEAMQAKGLAHYLIFHPTCIHWLTGAEAKSYQAFQCLIADASSARLSMFTRMAEQNEFADDAEIDDLYEWGSTAAPEPIAAFLALAAQRGFSHGQRVGMEVPAYYLHPHHYARLRDAFAQPPEEHPDLVHNLRLARSSVETSYLREAGRIADASILAIRNMLAPGKTEREIAAVLYSTVLEAGGDPLPVSPNIVSGPRAAYSHGAPTSRRLEPGDSGNVEYCVPFHRYCVSLGRTFCLGRPKPLLQQLHDTVLRAADEAIAIIRDGVAVSKVATAMRQVLVDAGMEKHQVHTIGYSVAPAFPPATGEILQISSASNLILKAGMSLSISPNLFLRDERLGARIVDNVVVTEGGIEFLTHSPRELMAIQV